VNPREFKIRREKKRKWKRCPSITLLESFGRGCEGEEKERGKIETTLGENKSKVDKKNKKKEKKKKKKRGVLLRRVLVGRRNQREHKNLRKALHA